MSGVWSVTPNDKGMFRIDDGTGGSVRFTPEDFDRLLYTIFECEYDAAPEQLNVLMDMLHVDWPRKDTSS